jgi:glucokinase
VGNREVIRWVKAQLAAGRKSILLRLVKGDLGKLQPEIIDEGCRLGDPLALETWVRVGETLGFALSGVVNLLSPERIVIGGGIAKARPWLFPAIRRTLRHRAMRGMRGVSVVPAQLGSSAGMIGAALLAQGIGEER